MMNDAVYFSNDRLPLVIRLEDIDDADDAADTMKWVPDSADTLVMRPASMGQDLERYLRSGGLPLSLRSSMILSMMMLGALLIAFIAIHS